MDYPKLVKDLDQENYEKLLKRFSEVLESENFLDTLYAFGVDNWEGYSEAVDSFEEEKD